MNNANEYIISQLKKPINYSDIDFILWMVNKMTHEEVCSLDSDLSEISETVSMNEEFVYDWDAIRRICHCIKKLKARYSGGNKTLSKLIAELKENNSFEVADELFDRFDYISYNEQKRVLKALLNSEYRCMARQLLDDEWAKMFLTTLQRNWIKEGDTTAVKYIIKYSDEDFLLKHIDKLANEWTSEYNLLCIRLGHNPRFTLDEKLLWRKWSYYTVMCVLGRGINSKEILAEVFSEVKQAIFDASDSLADIEKSIWAKGLYVSAKLIPGVEHALQAMRDAELNDELEFFYKWDSDIRAKLKEAVEELYHQGEECDSLEKMWTLYCDIAKQNFPDYSLFSTESSKCKEEVVEKLKPMLEELGLDLEDSPFDNFPAPRLKAPYSKPTPSVGHLRIHYFRREGEQVGVLQNAHAYSESYSASKWRTYTESGMYFDES